MINDDNKKSFKKMLKSNALYFALGLCLLGAGVAGYVASADKTPAAPIENGAYEYEKSPVGNENVTQKKEKVQIEVDIEDYMTEPYSQPPAQEVFDNSAPKVEDTPTEIQEEKPAIVYSSPLNSLTSGKDYSMGIPVFSDTMKDYRTHNGIDFKAVEGENIMTIAPGTVVSVKNDAVWGNTVTIDHGDGTLSSISGVSDNIYVNAGDTLYERTVIGTVGTIPVESAEGTHIHLEVRVNGELVDPLEILGLAEGEE